MYGHLFEDHQKKKGEEKNIFFIIDLYMSMLTHVHVVPYFGRLKDLGPHEREKDNLSDKTPLHLAAHRYVCMHVCI